MKKIAVVISVEHAVNTIPKAYQGLFSKDEAVLNTHRAVDFGAKTIAEHLASQVPCDYYEATVSRLLIDCNRSLSHPTCFSEFTKPLSADDKETLIHDYYLPFRQPIEQCIESHIKNNRQVLHLSIHSFTHELHGIQRNAAIGLLYIQSEAPRKKSLAFGTPYLHMSRHRIMLE
ncbi:MAG: N-formylglutamate amidohydrolase [Legionellaceae bacterium]